MKKILIIFLIVATLSILATLYNSSPKAIVSRLISKGELCCGELRYRIDLLGFLPIGEAVLNENKLEEYKGRSVYHLSAAASTSHILNRFFRSHAVLDSYIDTENFSPLLFRQKLISPGKESPDKEVVYDQKNGIMVIGNVRRQILPNTQDPLSLMFNIRRMNFDNVKTLEMNINTNQKNYVLEGKVRQEQISAGNKPYTIVIIDAEIKRRDKNPYHKSNVKMVLLKDKENIPLLIKVFASGAIINAELMEIK